MLIVIKDYYSPHENWPWRSCAISR